MSDSELDRVRELIAERARFHRFSLTELSKMLGKNGSYLQQYISRGTPAQLSEDLRVELARILEVHENDLRPRRRNAEIDRAVISTFYDADEPVPGQTPKSGKEIPVFREDGLIQPGRNIEWTDAPTSATGDSTLFAVWIVRPWQRFRPGDMVFVRRGQAPRIGDAVVAVRAGLITTIGDLAAIDGEEATIAPAPGKQVTIKRAEARVFKIAHATFA